MADDSKRKYCAHLNMLSVGGVLREPSTKGFGHASSLDDPRRTGGLAGWESFSDASGGFRIQQTIRSACFEPSRPGRRRVGVGPVDIQISLQIQMTKQTL